MPYAWTPDDLDTLVALSANTKPKPIDPVGVALLLWVESAGFNPANLGPSKANPQVGGLNQMSTPNLVGLGLSRSTWLTMTAAEQLPYVFKFWAGLAARFNGGRFPADAARLLALNFLPASYAASGADTNDNAALCGSAGPYAQYYKWNAYYDPGQLGAVTVATIRVRQKLEAQNGGARWNQLVADINAAKQRAMGGGGGGGSTPPAGPPISGSPPPGAPSSAPPSVARPGGGLTPALALALLAGVVARVRA